MSGFNALLDQVELPELYHVQQEFDRSHLSDIDAQVSNTLEASSLARRFKAGARIAIGVGSRGIANLPEIIQATAAWFTAQGAKPFIVPAMGSHGGATAEGQRAVLEHLGITETAVSCPIETTMETVTLGRLDNGLPVYLDRSAAQADGIFVVNRIKPHTGFSGKHESGLIKMMTIGLGKQKGAEACHSRGYSVFGENMSAITAILLEKCPALLGGLAIVENAYDQTCLLEAVPSESLYERDAALLKYAFGKMGKIYTDSLDVLVVERMGKEISGAGMDPNILGRSISHFKKGTLDCAKIGVLRLTPASEGNACGVGLADVITRELFDHIDFGYTYANVITSTILRAAFVPAVMPTDEAALRCLVKTCNAPEGAVRLVFIRDTLSLEDLWVSRLVAEEMTAHENCRVDMTPHPMVFTPEGRCSFPKWSH